MRLWIAAAGRIKSGPCHELYRDYAGRMTWPLTLREIECRRPGSVEERRRAEAELLRAAIPATARLVVLDEHGEGLTSTGFAARLAVWRDGGVADCGFVIGGADGVAASLRDQADLVLCFGTMTWPHQLVRGMLVEQLYRVQQILSGHPYHRS